MKSQIIIFLLVTSVFVSKCSDIEENEYYYRMACNAISGIINVCYELGISDTTMSDEENKNQCWDFIKSKLIETPDEMFRNMFEIQYVIKKRRLFS